MISYDNENFPMYPYLTKKTKTQIIIKNNNKYMVISMPYRDSTTKKNIATNLYLYT